MFRRWHLSTVLVTTSPCGLCLPPVSLSEIYSVWNQAQSSADVTAQISVTAANIFELLLSGCRRHWEVLETIALTVSEANHSWKGDSTFGCYFAGGGKNTYKLIHSGCGKCVWYIHISKESFWQEKHAMVIISRHPAFNTLMILYFLGASRLIHKLSFHKKIREEQRRATPVELLRTQVLNIWGDSWMCFMQTTSDRLEMKPGQIWKQALSVKTRK